MIINEKKQYFDVGSETMHEGDPNLGWLSILRLSRPIKRI